MNEKEMLVLYELIDEYADMLGLDLESGDLEYFAGIYLSSNNECLETCLIDAIHAEIEKRAK